MVGVGIGLGVSGYRLRTGFEVLPTLDLQFATKKSIAPLIGPTPTFTRASTGTYFNSQGVLTSAGVNEARFDHIYNGSNWVSKGLLVEMQRTNIVLQSNNFGLSPWFIGASRGTVTQNATSPDGTANAWTATCTTTHAGGFYLAQTGISAASGTYTFSMFAKKGNNGFTGVQVYDSISGNYATVYFDLTNGLSESAQTSGYTIISHGIINCGNGWYRCYFTFNKGNSNALDIYPILTPNSMGAFAATSGQTNLFYGFQLESGSFPTSYTPTTSSSVTRSADVCQINGVDFGSLWNAVEGTVVVEYDRLAPIGSTTPGYSYPRVFEFYGSSGNLIELYGNHVAEKEEASAFNSSVLQFVLAPTTTENVAFGRQSVALGIKENDVALAYKGGSVLTDSSFTMPSVNSLFIGSLNNGSYFHNGHIARLRYYNARLNNETIRYLST